MIPLPWLKAIPWRLVGWATVAICISLAAWRVHAWRDGYLALPAAQAALKAEIDCGEGSKCAERVAALQARQDAIQQEVLRGYEQELADLRGRPVRTNPVRLCVPASGSPVRVPSVASGTDRDPAAGVLDRPHGGDYQPGPDIGPILRQYAKEVEELSASKRAIVRRDEALSTVE